MDATATPLPDAPRFNAENATPPAAPKRSHKRKPGNSAPPRARRHRPADPAARDAAAFDSLRELGADEPEQLEQHQVEFGAPLPPLVPPRDPALVAKDVANLIRATANGVLLFRAKRTGVVRPEIVEAIGNVAQGVGEMAAGRMPAHVGSHWGFQLAGMIAEVAVAMTSPALAAFPSEPALVGG